jgi:PAS domain S-box-containing protein
MYISVNDEFCRITGYEKGELLKRTIKDISHEDDYLSETRLQEQLIAGEIQSYKLEKRYIGKNGEIIWVHVIRSLVRASKGKAPYMVVIVQDRTEELNSLVLTLREEISEREQAEKALRKTGKRLQELSLRLVEAQDKERRALARELHDRLGQTLSALNLDLTTMNNQLSEDSKQRLGSRLADSLHLVAEASSLVRNVMADLRPAELEDYGLEAALEAYINEYSSRYEIKVFFDHSKQPIPRLGHINEITLLRIAQEAMTNVARHAQADQVNLCLQREGNVITMTIEDNGVGIPSLQESTRPNSHGLTFMRERIETVGGNFKIFSTPGTGTKIEVTALLENGASKLQIPG